MPKKLRDQPQYQELLDILQKQPQERQGRLLERLDELEAEEVQKEVYRVEEAAQLLGVAENTVRGWLKSGKISGRKIGKLWLIPRQEVIRILEP